MEEKTPAQATDENYELLDSGGGRVLERLGGHVTTRACSQAWWRRKLGGGDWRKSQDLKQAAKTPIKIRVGTLLFQVGGAGGSFRALGPELRDSWQRVTEMCAAYAAKNRRPARVLHLFAGVGGHTLAAAAGGASVAHVEASAESLSRARENAALNPLASRDIRWVADDPVKFAQRERLQNQRHDLIILDPHSSREAKHGFDLERGLPALLATMSGLLSDTPLGVVLVCRQGFIWPTTLLQLMRHDLSIFGGTFEHGELLLSGAESVPAVPCGAYCRWWK
ncbi:MAG: class I SAM-dependent methyltransferase [Verrucomicrobiaceae bacterium]|nr:class I SAM-dependent methyltransferase [Verrucomicrobiaceae bacterium]